MHSNHPRPQIARPAGSRPDPFHDREVAVIRAWLHAAADDETLDVYSGKRRVRRWSWNNSMEMRLDGQTHFVYAEDLSPLSIGIVSRVAMKPNQQIELRRDESEDWVHATVKQVIETVGGYRVGLSFDNAPPQASPPAAGPA